MLWNILSLIVPELVKLAETLITGKGKGTTKKTVVLGTIERLLDTLVNAGVLVSDELLKAQTAVPEYIDKVVKLNNASGWTEKVADVVQPAGVKVTIYVSSGLEQPSK